MLFVLQLIVLVASPPPSTVIGYFTLFHKNALLGLLDLDLLSLADYVLFVPMFLALYAALRRASPSFMAIATTLALVGIAAYFASNTDFNMLSLSNQYAAATTETQRSTFEASGQAMLTIYQGTAFYVSYVLLIIAPLIITDPPHTELATIFMDNLFTSMQAEERWYVRTCKTLRGKSALLFSLCLAEVVMNELHRNRTFPYA